MTKAYLIIYNHEKSNIDQCKEAGEINMKPSIIGMIGSHRKHAVAALHAVFRI